MRKQQIHLAWGSICLAMVGLTHGLTAAEGSRDKDQSARRPAVRFVPLQASAAPKTPFASPGAALVAPPSSATQATLSPSLASGRRSPPAQANLAVAGDPTPAPFRVEGPGLVPDAQFAIALHPEAEALVRALFRVRLRLDRAPDPRDFVAEIVLEIAHSLPSRDARRLILALTAYVPGQDTCEHDGDGTARNEFVAIRTSIYDRAPTSENLERLLGLLKSRSADQLDPRLIERLLRSHPDNDTLQRLFVRSAPERAAEVFGRDGLSESERRLVVGLVAREDVVKAAALALELFAEERNVDDLITAMKHDPKAVEAFLRQRKGDPTWRELATLARLRISYGSDETRESARVFARSWELLSPESLVEALDISTGYGNTWTPFQGKALTRIVESGDAELVERALQLAPTRERWRVLAGTNYKIESDDSNPEAQRYLRFISREPFAARGMLPSFFQIYPVLEPQDALWIAQSFQSKGDAGAAREVLERARVTTFIQKAKRHLARGFSLDELEADDDEEE
ncbi:MAG: hypothetical protein JKY65_03475 [Planctomycetes bacterium]|nr:hypothetical protein [Planctomycetota bacterium]